MDATTGPPDDQNQAQPRAKGTSQVTTITSISRDRNAGTVSDYPGTPPIVLARRARHRHPNRRRAVIRKALAALFALAALLIVAGGARSEAPAFHTLTPGQVVQLGTTLEAPGYQLTADVQPVNWPWLACAEFDHYVRGDTRPALERLYVAYRHLAPGYLRTDVFWLLHDAKHHRNTDLAVQYLFEDCNGGSGS